MRSASSNLVPPSSVLLGFPGRDEGSQRWIVDDHDPHHVEARGLRFEVLVDLAEHDTRSAVFWKTKYARRDRGERDRVQLELVRHLQRTSYCAPQPCVLVT